jgi:hypothetical protein
MSNFSRPYLLNFAGVIITIIVVLAGVLLVYSGCFLLLALFNYRHSSEFDFEYHGQLIIRVYMTPERLFWLANVTVLSVGLFSGSVLYLISLGVFGLTALMAIQDFAWRLKSFIPNTGISILELDHVIALAGGFVTFLFSLYYTFKSILQSISDANEQQELRIQHVEVELQNRRRKLIE